MSTSDFTAAEVAKLAGIPLGTLDRWLRQRVVTRDDRRRESAARAFGFRDVVLVTLARALRDRGFSLSATAAIVTLVREHWTGDDPAGAGLVYVQCFAETIESTWLEQPLGLNAFLAGGRVRLGGDNPWTGVHVLVDVISIARCARERVECGMRPLPKSVGSGAPRREAEESLSLTFAVTTYAGAATGGDGETARR